MITADTPTEPPRQPPIGMITGNTPACHQVIMPTADRPGGSARAPPLDRPHGSASGRSSHGEQLESLYAQFPREQVLVLLYRDVPKRPLEVLDRTDVVALRTGTHTFG